MNARKSFLDFFRERNHNIIPSDSLIPSSDPTLLFTSAGMVQFKKYFLGEQKMNPPRAASSQKCFRTSDLDRIGHTPRHLSFFEMLGNFSFGDYFKQDAIAWGWEFLTKTTGIPPKKLSVTIYKDDEEAFGIWRKVVPESKIYRLGNETNFWNMGPTGPCGPCSEIIYDMGAELKCAKPGCGPGCDCDRWLEVWNLVFTQFNRDESGKLHNLPMKNIDTGMGLERLAVAAAGKKSVFETDFFVPIMEETAKIFGNLPKSAAAPAHNGLDSRFRGNDKRAGGNDSAPYRIIADHARAATFLISDGILPANEGRGYVLRRIIRRAVRQARVLGYDKPFIYRLCGKVVEMMKDAYPDLTVKRENIAMMAKMEEEKFLETLDAGISRLEELMQTALGAGTKEIPGRDVFYLYDTYGFPAELTKEILSEKGLIFKQEDYEQSRESAREVAKKSWKGVAVADLTAYKRLAQSSFFTGYEELSTGSTITGIIMGGSETDSISEGDAGEIVLVKTPFYAESGGQVGDKGRIYAQGEKTAEVLDTVKPAEGVIVHKIKVTKGVFRKSDAVTAEVDAARRKSVMRHHTATHLLHKALRTVLGEHATQSGSLVGPDGFRFDFTHFKALAPQEIERIEDLVNEKIMECIPVKTTIMSIEQARKYNAMALFGEKYGNEVRCVYAGETPETAYSVELCGGTHTHNTGEIGFFKITGESSIGSGLRRIEAVCGRAAILLVRDNDSVLFIAAQKMKSSVTELPGRIDALLQRQKRLEKDIENLRTRPAAGGAEQKDFNLKGSVKLAVVSASDANIEDKNLRVMADNVREKIKGPSIVFVSNSVPEKFSFVITCSKELAQSGFDAGRAAKEFAGLIDGSAGGRKDFAQGGARSAAKVDEALSQLPEIIGKFL